MLKQEVLDKIKESPTNSSIYVGCDSSVSNKSRKDKTKIAKYVTVVIIHWGSNNGAKLYFDVEHQRAYGLKERLLYEAHLAITKAVELLPHLGGRKLQVHLDLNPDPKHKSSVAVAEALGYARGMGLDARVKPESFAASHAADHRT